MKRLMCALFIVLFLPGVIWAKKVVFAYGGGSLCRNVESVVEDYGKGWKVFCYYGNPYKSGRSIKLISKLKPDVILFPAVLYPLFVKSGFTGSVDYYKRAGKWLYVGVWAGAVSKDAQKMVDLISEKLKETSLLKETDVDPDGWWLYQLSRKTWMDSFTPVKNPMSGVKAGIYRYKVDGYPRKVFLVSFDTPKIALSTLEGMRKVRAVGNVYLHPHFWKRCTPVEKLKEEVVKHFGLSNVETFLLFTGADMDNIAFAKESFEDIVVWAAVTAGVLGNAMRAGVDEGHWLKKDGKWVHVGTINIIVFVNKRLSDVALIQSVVRITEAKSAVLQELKVESTYTPGVIATGTGTDNVLVVSGTEDPELESAGGHTKLAELMAKAVRRTLFRALYNQDGLEP